jgi:hypothetical protein
MKENSAGNLSFVYAKSPYSHWINTIESEERICRRSLDLSALEASLVSFELGRTKQFLEGGGKNNSNPHPVPAKPDAAVPLMGLETKQGNKPLAPKPLHVNSEGKVTQNKNLKKNGEPTREDLLKAGLCFWFQTGTCHFKDKCKYSHEKFDPKKLYSAEVVKRDRGYGLWHVAPVPPVPILGSDIVLGSDITSGNGNPLGE